MVEQAVNAILASGPMAIVLGLACYTLWQENKAIRKECAEKDAANDKRFDDLQAKYLSFLERIADHPEKRG